MESLGWAVVHMCWQGLLLGAWWLLFASAQRRRGSVIGSGGAFSA